MSKFVKPTIAEIQEYAKEVFPQLDAGRFWDYYESCGWTVGRNKPMKVWQSAIRLWKRNFMERNNIQTKPTENWKDRFNKAEYNA